VAAYGFNEGSGMIVTDASGNGNNGTISGATWTTSGKYGNALMFNGTSALVTVNDSNSLDLTTGMTLEAWLYPTALEGWRDVITKGTDDIYHLTGSSDDSTPALGGTFSPSVLRGTSSLPLNAWTHLAGTYDGTTMRLYVNGVQVSSQAQTGLIQTSTAALTMGGDALHGQYFAGLIDEVRIYNRALSVAEIQSDMNPARTDDFNRADGALGPNWADLPEGGVAIASGQAVGTRSGSSSGSYRIDGSYNNDQYSEITVTSSPLSAWIGASVRNQGNGNLYLGIYYANGATPQLRLYKRLDGAWTQLGASYDCGTLAAGTKLRVMVLGARLAFLQDGVERIEVSDADISGGAPGIMIWDTDALDNWAGGDARFEAHYLSTDENGIESYQMISAYNGYGPHVLRVLRPDNPAPGVAHHLLYVLEVSPEGDTTYGDGLETLRLLGAHNQYNVTLIAPSFPTDPWYADHPTDPNLKYESFMSWELQPWVTTNLTSTGSEQHWLLGFSKSGIGGLDLLFKHPDLFTLGAFWDFPALGFTVFDQFGSSSASNYGTDANFQANYRLTAAFVQAHANPFLIDNRVWISGYLYFPQEVADFDALLTATGIPHTLAPQTPRPPHGWDSGWVPEAVSGLYQNSINLGNQ
jgi:hypothetical protein